MSVQALAWVLERESSTTGSDRLVLLSLANHANDAREAWPSIDTIMREAGIRRRQTVKDALGRLEAKRLIARLVNGAPDQRLRGDRRPNLYVLAVDGGELPTGAREPSERGHGDRADGGTESAPAGAREPSPKPSGEPPPDPSGEPGELFHVEHEGDEDDPASRPLRSGEQVPTYEFADWYREYPLHKGRGQAERAYAGARRKASAAVLLDGARAYRDDPQRDPKFTAHPATWLNGERWLDERGPADRAPESSWDRGEASGEVGSDEL